MTDAERNAQFFPHSMHSGYGGQLPASAHALNHLLSQRTGAENVTALTGFICEAMRFRNEEAMLLGFEWLCRAWERFDNDVRMGGAGGILDRALENVSANATGHEVADALRAWDADEFAMMRLDRLIDLYAMIPHGEGFLMLKIEIIKKSVREFFSPERTEVAKKALSFFLGMGYATSKRYMFDHPYPDVRERLADRCVTKAERDALENALREKMGSWRIEDVEGWFRAWKGFRFMPEEALNIFALVWGRTGGASLMKGSLADRDLLARFDRTKRSSVAMNLFKLSSDEIVDFDIRIALLLERMIPDERPNAWGDDNVGECMQLYGTVKIGSERIGELVIELRLPEGFPDPLGRDVARRARQHVEEWKGGNGEGIVVQLTTMLNDGSGAVHSTFR